MALTDTKSRKSDVIESLTRHAQVNGLRVGDKLPSIRTVAGQLGYAHATVAEAYKTLAENGYVESRKKLGTTIVKDLVSQGSCVMHRIFLFVDVHGYVDPEFLAGLDLLRKGIYRRLPGAELLVLTWDSLAAGLNELKDMLHYHYWIRKNEQQNIVFVLSHCPKWIKVFFQEEGIPALVNGGLEDGISLPNVCHDIEFAMDAICEQLERKQAYPVVYLLDPSALLGTHVYYYARFRDLELGPEKTSVPNNSLQLDESEEICDSQIAQLLNSPNRPRTIVTQNDATGCKVARICRNLGLRVPEEVSIISLTTSCLAKYMIPSLTGVYADVPNVGELIGDIVSDIAAGKDVKGRHVKTNPLIIFRESFPES